MYTYICDDNNDKNNNIDDNSFVFFGFVYLFLLFFGFIYLIHVKFLD